MNMSTLKPTVYFAGKIGKNDWRHSLVPDLHGHEWDEGPINVGQYLYVGPFFVASDHSWYHGTNTHGALCKPFTFRQDYNQDDIIRNNNASLQWADLVFAYITATDCYGTLVELGWAIHAGKRVVMAFAPEIPYQDFWYSSMQSASVYHEINECCLPVLIAKELEALK